MAFMLTRAQVGDYEAWKSVFDSDPPNAREAAKGHRVMRSVEDPNEVYVQVEFPTREAAEDARRRLLESGVLDRLEDHTGPTVVEQAEAVGY
jgi:hypothetical protein